MTNVTIRHVIDSDLEILFHQQNEPEAIELGALFSRDRDSFYTHWNKILSDETVILRTVVADGEVAGNVVSFIRSGHRQVGYWLGKAYWGRGIATRALSLLLEEISERPLYGHVAKRNTPSRRVLEKCGFAVVEDDPEFNVIDGIKIEGYILELP